MIFPRCLIFRSSPRLRIHLKYVSFSLLQVLAFSLTSPLAHLAHPFHHTSYLLLWVMTPHSYPASERISHVLPHQSVQRVLKLLVLLDSCTRTSPCAPRIYVHFHWPAAPWMIAPN